MELVKYIHGNFEAILSVLYLIIIIIYLFIFSLFYYKKTMEDMRLKNFINGLIVLNNTNRIISTADVNNLFMAYYNLKTVTSNSYSHFVLTLRKAIKLITMNLHKYGKKVEKGAAKTLPDIIDILNQTITQFNENNEFYDVPESIAILLRDLQQSIKSTNVEAGLSRVGDVKRTLTEMYKDNEFLKQLSEKQSFYTRIGIGITFAFGLLSLRTFF